MTDLLKDSDKRSRHPASSSQARTKNSMNQSTANINSVTQYFSRPTMPSIQTSSHDMPVTQHCSDAASMAYLAGRFEASTLKDHDFEVLAYGRSSLFFLVFFARSQSLHSFIRT